MSFTRISLGSTKFTVGVIVIFVTVGLFLWGFDVKKAAQEIKENGDETRQIRRGYEAGFGWDACTGWGSPDGRKLLAALRSHVLT
jgi:hypothetical protein